MQNEGVGPEEKDFIGEVIAQDNEARKLRTIGEQVGRVTFLSEAEVLAVVTLGGYFSSEELGDIDIEPRMAVLEKIQQDVVSTYSDEHLELVDIAHVVRLQSEVCRKDTEIARLNAVLAASNTKRVPRLSDDPAVRLAECRGEAVAFDEEAERALFESQYVREQQRGDSGRYTDLVVQNRFDGWIMCAKSRAGVV